MNDGALKIEYAKDLEAVLRAFRACREEQSFADKDLREADGETQDILHKFELDDTLKYKDRAELGKEMAEVRKRRRVAKDTVERLEPLTAFIGNNAVLINGLERALGEMRKIESRHKNRIYTPRVMKGEAKR